jgi:UDP-glucuronate decarboxylase
MAGKSVFSHALMLMMNSRSDFTGPVNIGNPEEFVITEQAKKIIALIGREPKVSLRDGLKETIVYFKKFI